MTADDFRHSFRVLSGAHWVIASGESTSTGSVALVIAKAVCKDEPEHIELERGRVLQVICRTGGGRLDVVVVHNFDIGGHTMRRVAAALREAEERHMASPHVHRSIALGDFNFEARGVGGRLPRTRSDRIPDFELQCWTELGFPGATFFP